MANIEVKSFDELTTNELWELYHLRCKVFIVEQQCFYQDIDEFDKLAYHVLAHDEGGELVGCARVIPAGTVFATPSLGRVISMQRRTGLGTEIVRAAIDTARERLGADELTIEAQTYARKLYENLGFEQTSEPFLEDGIEHIQMKKALQ